MVIFKGLIVRNLPMPPQSPIKTRKFQILPKTHNRKTAALSSWPINPKTSLHSPPRDKSRPRTTQTPPKKLKSCNTIRGTSRSLLQPSANPYGSQESLEALLHCVEMQFPTVNSNNSRELDIIQSDAYTGRADELFSLFKSRELLCFWDTFFLFFRNDIQRHTYTRSR